MIHYSSIKIQSWQRLAKKGLVRSQDICVQILPCLWSQQSGLLHPHTPIKRVNTALNRYGRLDDGSRAGETGEADVESGGDLRLAPPGVGQHRPHPRRREDVRGVHPGAADRPRRHLRPAAPQHRPAAPQHRPRDGRRRVPSGSRGVPGQGARRGLLPVRLPRVQLLHLRPAEERAGLGVTPSERVGGQGGRRGECVGEVRREADGVPRPAGGGVPGHALRQQARGVRAGALSDRQVRRRREPGRSGDGGAAEEDPPGSAGVRAQAHLG